MLKKALATGLVALLLSGPATAGGWFEPWSDGDYARQAVVFGTMYIDWRQSHEIADHPDKYREINPLLGDHPSGADVDRVFLATAIIHSSVVYAMPARWRPAFQWFTVGFETSSIGRNWQIGIRLGF